MDPFAVPKVTDVAFDHVSLSVLRLETGESETSTPSVDVGGSSGDEPGGRFWKITSTPLSAAKSVWRRLAVAATAPGV
jgi:hypothetical protein